MIVAFDDFWGDNFYNHPTLTNKMLQIAEERLQIKLPQLYVDILKIQNGGYTKGYIFPTKTQTSWSPTFVSLEDLCGIVLDKSIVSPLNLMNTEYFISEDWGLPQKTVAITGDGHWWITLDYRNNLDEPEITWIDAEWKQDIKLAENFNEFFNGLVLATEFVK